MIKCDFHLHTFASHDSLTNARQIEDICKRKHIHAIAVTDHNQIHGAFKIQESLKNIKVIIGEEIKTLQGDVIGLFLKNKIEPNKDIKETVQEIKSQGGIVYLPHPFDTSTGKRNAVNKENAERVIEYIDIVEIFNARTFDNKFNIMAKEFALKHSKAALAGSDAHVAAEIGNAGFDVEDFNTAEEFVKNIKTAITFGQRTNPLYYLHTKVVRMMKKYGKYL